MDNLYPMEMWEYDQRIRFEWIDIFATVGTAVLILIFSFLFQSRKLKLDKSYKHYMTGLAAKMAGTFFFCSIYLFYYKGGDTVSYFESTMAMVNLFYKDPSKYIEVMLSPPSVETRSLFDDKTGFPYSYMFFDSHTFMVIKITSIFSLLTSKSYFLTSLLISYLSYFSIWKLFLMFRDYAPEIESKLAWAILYFPSPLFWGGGISKDTYTYMATAMFIFSAHKFFILKKREIGSVILMALASWLIINIKPYIFIVLFPGGLLWIFYDKLQRVNSKFVSYIIFPIIIAGILGLSFYVLNSLGGSMSKFSLERAFETAAVTNHDLKQSYYGGSSFDIGDFDGTFNGMIRLFLPALNAGLFRPYFLIDGTSIVILLAGLENLFLLGFVLYIIFTTKLKGALKIIVANPIILFCVIFSILFGFMIGLTTSNFGALVRFKIPLVPYFVSALFLIDYCYKQIKKRDIFF
ncbi:MAG: hypothetical protein J0L69_03190 [Bacteroidetes bacterium]|nr:hypothetical protein [Bacteroidota bacterium]